MGCDVEGSATTSSICSMKSRGPSSRGSLRDQACDTIEQRHAYSVSTILRGRTLTRFSLSFVYCVHICIYIYMYVLYFSSGLMIALPKVCYVFSLLSRFHL